MKEISPGGYGPMARLVRESSHCSAKLQHSRSSNSGNISVIYLKGTMEITFNKKPNDSYIYLTINNKSNTFIINVLLIYLPINIYLYILVLLAIQLCIALLKIIIS